MNFTLYLKMEEIYPNIFVDLRYGFNIKCSSEISDEYSIFLWDESDDSEKHYFDLSPDFFIKTNREYFCDWKLQLLKNNEGVVLEYKPELKNKKVLISLWSKALGDTIAWLPYCDEFRKKHNCDVYVFTHFKNLFRESYPNLKWFDDEIHNENNYEFFASYAILVGIDKEKHNEGINKLNDYFRKKINVKYIENLSFYDKRLHKEHPMYIPLQQVASNVLGLEYEEIQTIINVKNNDRPIEKKYICISEFASAGGLKIWQNSIGWQSIVDFFVRLGYEVVSISKEKSTLKNITKRNGDFSLEDRLWYLKHSEFFVGMPSGLSWLAWTTNIKVVMIGGFSEDWFEFSKNCIRVKNYDSCTGCFNSEKHADKLCCYHDSFCPENKNFECSRKISPKMVLNKIVENGLLI